MRKDFRFERIAQDREARRGRVTTAHGIIETPAFMPVGTAATVKAMLPDSVARTGAQIVLGNTYHLMLRPGAERIACLGGLRRFMNWKGPVLTDSGGFQVMSLADLRKMSEEGVTFRSHIDGSYHKITPERSVEIQHLLGSTITMVFDECTPYPVDEKKAAQSMRLSMRWAERSRHTWIDRPGYAIYGIVQGSVYPELRAESIESLVKLDFPGYAIGGLAVGEGQEMMFKTLEKTAPLMPEEKPRYLMGVGKPADLVGSVARGVDMFDCVMPTRAGRTGQVFTHRAVLNIKNARHKDDPRPIDENCSCPACRHYSRAYVHHLVRSDEILGSMLLTWHNLQYYQDLMAAMRQAIEQQCFCEFEQKFHKTQALGDIEVL